ncbi:MAG: hypothetical protein PHQ43_14600 [Dehalococcoidales bacterium]|nr:hypothetical protein [Dehalococcoidales bacterium]
MAIKVEDLGELAYGGLVTGARYMDDKRMTEGKLADDEFFKKYQTYAYLVPGGVATIMSAFGVWRRYSPWIENISHGFIYGFPQFLMDTINSMKGTSAKSAAVREAQKIMASRRADRQLGAAKTSRTYQPEFKSAMAW